MENIALQQNVAVTHADVFVELITFLFGIVALILLQHASLL